MSFPEHENPELQDLKIEEKIPEDKKVEVKKNEGKKVETKKIETKKEVKSHNLRVNVPSKAEPAFKPVKRGSIIRRDIGDITPTLFANFSLGIIPEDYDNAQDMFGVNTPIGMNAPDSGRIEPLSAYHFNLPEYCLQNSFQHYISPRNSK